MFGLADLVGVDLMPSVNASLATTLAGDGTPYASLVLYATAADATTYPHRHPLML